MRRKEIALVLTFIALSVIGIFRHELSLDEVRPLLIASEHDWSGIYSAVRCDFNCLPWYYAAKGLVSVTAPPASVQFLSLLFSSLAFALIAFMSPFSFFEKILLATNYFLFFEYNILGRPYSLMVLGIVLVAFSWSRRTEKPALYLCGLIVLTQSTYPGILLALPFIGLFLLDLVRRKISPGRSYGTWIALVFLLFSIINYFWPALPGSQCRFVFPMLKPVEENKILYVLWNMARSFFPIVTNTWNEHLFDRNPTMAVALTVLFVVAVATLVWNFRKDRNVLLIFIGGILAFFSYDFLKPMMYGSYYRHMGALTLLLLVCSWIFFQENSGPTLFRRIFPVFLLVSAFSGIKMYSEDLVHVFGSGKEVHEVISKPPYDQLPIVGDNLMFSSAFIIYEKRGYYSVYHGEDIRYMSLTDNRPYPKVVRRALKNGLATASATDADLDQALADKIKQSPQGVLLIVNYLMDEERKRGLGLEQIATFPDTLNAHESFTIYLYRGPQVKSGT